MLPAAQPDNRPDWPGRSHGIRPPTSEETPLSWAEVHHARCAGLCLFVQLGMVLSADLLEREAVDLRADSGGGEAIPLAMLRGGVSCRKPWPGGMLVPGVACDGWSGIKVQSVAGLPGAALPAG